VKLNKGDRRATRARARSPRRAEAEGVGVGVTSVRCGAVRSVGQTDGRDVLRGGSIFLLLMTP
jgi:hypothetical protein